MSKKVPSVSVAVNSPKTYNFQCVNVTFVTVIG